MMTGCRVHGAAGPRPGAVVIERSPENTPSVFIAVPSRDATAQTISGKLALLLVDLARRPDAPVVDIVSGYPVDRVRNQICRRFLESDAEYLLMIDDDVVPPPTVLDMARHRKDVVAGLCYAYTPSTGYYTVAYEPPAADGERPPRLPIGDGIEGHGLLEVELTGTACLMVHRRVLEGVDRPWFAMELDEDRLVIADSEDFSFCRKIRAAGFSVWLDSDTVCCHFRTLDMKASVGWAQQYAARQRLADLDL
jgi:hypothetical protein